jgi:hypothetical protein
MRNIKSNSKLISLLAFGGLICGTVLYGCKSNQESPPAPAADATTQPKSFALFGPPPQRTGVELWADTCARCHNARPTEEFSGQQWEVIVHHMRLRANLTGEEAREIVAFLKASH